MKNLTKNLLLLIAIFPVIILLSSVLAQKSVALNDQCSQWLGCLNDREIQKKSPPPYCYGDCKVLNSFSGPYKYCYSTKVGNSCTTGVGATGVCDTQGDCIEIAEALPPTPTPTPPSCSSYTAKGSSECNSDSRCEWYTKGLGNKGCKVKGGSPTPTPTATPVPPAATVTSLKWTVIASSCSAPTPIQTPQPPSAPRVTEIGDYCDAFFNKCSSGQTCDIPSCDEDVCIGTCVLNQSAAPTATPTPTPVPPTSTLAPGAPTATPTPLPGCQIGSGSCALGNFDGNIHGQCSCQMNVAGGLSQAACASRNGRYCDTPQRGKECWYVDPFPVCLPTPTPTSTPASSVSIPSATPTPTPTSIPAGKTFLKFNIALSEIGPNPKRTLRNLAIEIFDPLNNNQKIEHSINESIVGINYDLTQKILKGGNSLPDTDWVPKSGIYSIKVKSDGYLRKLILSVPITKGVQNDIALATLTPGDINGDNRIDILDYNLLKDCFGNKANTPTCSNKVNSDLNDDDVVDGIDVNAFIKGLSVKEGD